MQDPILAQVRNKLAVALREQQLTHTKFLNQDEQERAHVLLQREPDIVPIFYGGYPDAERRILVLLPDFWGIHTQEQLAERFQQNPDENPLTLLRVQKDAFHDVSHRDYLGAILGLGITRACVGDILVRQDGCDLLAMREIFLFLQQYLIKAGRATLALTEQPMENIYIPKSQAQQRAVTVASLRLDCVVAGVFSLSRAQAAEHIYAGNVLCNDRQMKKIDTPVCVNDKLVLRRRGRVILRRTDGQTRKGRIRLIYDAYV